MQICSGGNYAGYGSCPQPVPGALSEGQGHSLKRTGADGMPIFDDQQFWLYDNGQLDIDDYVIITEVGPAGGTYIFDVDITDSGLAVTRGANTLKARSNKKASLTSRPTLWN
jgi:hypothetical protein